MLINLMRSRIYSATWCGLAPLFLGINRSVVDSRKRFSSMRSMRIVIMEQDGSKLKCATLAIAKKNNIMTEIKNHNFCGGARTLKTWLGLKDENKNCAKKTSEFR